MGGVIDAEGDPAIARIATAQRGLITRRQLVEIGLGDGAIRHRVSRGRLHRVHRGVYLVGHPVAPPLARELAAVMACGDGAVLSHRSAIERWDLLPPRGGEVDVTIVGRDRGRHRPGIRVHRTRRLDPRDTTQRQGIPITAPARTLIDFAEIGTARELERAFDEAQTRRLLRREHLLATLARSPGRRGAGPLLALLRRQSGPAFTRSEAEERLLALIRRARLPPPHVNTRVGDHEVDFLWPSANLAVEVDGYAFHSTRAAFERDRLRDADLQARGLRVLRITWNQIVDEREAVVARLAQALSQGDLLAAQLTPASRPARA